MKPKHGSDSTQAATSQSVTAAAENPQPSPVASSANVVKPIADAPNGTTEVEKTKFDNAALVTEASDVLTQSNKSTLFLPFDLPKTAPSQATQIVTYSTRSIDNVSDQRHKYALAAKPGKGQRHHGRPQYLNSHVDQIWHNSRQRQCQLRE
jgi:hypothetical protein